MALLLLAGLLSSVAFGIEGEVGGVLQTDIRYQVNEVSTGSWYGRRSLGPGWVRNQNLLKLRGNVRQDKARLVFDSDLVYMGFPDPVDDILDTTRREVIDPFRVETHNLYVEAWDVGIPGLDIRVGQQKVQWGVGDQFNPTNNLNADDVEDPLLFGDQLGNVMARVDYTPVLGWTLSGVVVPVFKPGLVPSSAELGLAATDQVPVLNDDLRWTLLADQQQALNLGYATVANAVVPSLPEATWDNTQWSVRLAGSVGMHDVALSYYDGRFDFPVASYNHTTLESYEEPRCNPNDSEDCVNGLLNTEVGLVYPKMSVWGLNAAGEVNPLGWIGDAFKPIGYRMEVAWIFPEERRMVVTNDALDFGLLVQDAGEYDYGLPGGQRPVVLSDASFFKWTLGLDYTLTKFLYVNAQWVHGMPDEFGAGDWVVGGTNTLRAATVTDDTSALAGCAPLFDTATVAVDPRQCPTEWQRPRVGDYGVVGVDLRMGASLLRVFTILDFTPLYKSAYNADREQRVETKLSWNDPATRSMVVYPELSHNLGNGLELAGGAVVFMGGKGTKFGDPAVGGTQVFSRAKYSF